MDTLYTTKGKILALCNGYSMSFRRIRNCDGKWMWRCTNGGCGGTATSTNQEDLDEVNKHYGHLPDTALVEVRKRVSNAILQAEANRDTPVRTLVDQAFEGLNGELLHSMPAKETLTACLARHCNKDVGAVNR